MNYKAYKEGVAASMKSADTEEFIDIHFYRPIGYLWALLFKKLGIHPNVVTIASIFIGVAAGVMFYFPDLKLNIIGMLLLIWANSYDSADGQLARMTDKKTRWGRMLDGFAGDLWFFSIYLFICLRLTPEWGIWIWLLGAASGFLCHSKQCALADYYRNIHLFFLRGEEGSELDRGGEAKELFRSLPWKGNFWWKCFLFFYDRYTVSQELQTPNFQDMRDSVFLMYGKNIPTPLRNVLLDMSRPLMKYANMLTFNTRTIVLFIGLFIGMPWIYFVFELTVLNAMFYYMRHTHEKQCHKQKKRIKEGYYDEKE